MRIASVIRWMTFVAASMAAAASAAPVVVAGKLVLEFAEDGRTVTRVSFRPDDGEDKGAIDILDLRDLARFSPRACDPADVNADGKVDLRDLEAVRQAMTTTSRPAAAPTTRPAAPDLRPPTGADTYIGEQEAIGFNPFTDRKKSWWVWNADVNGRGADTAIYAVGRDCAIIRCKIHGGKHGIRMASVDGLRVIDCDIIGGGIKGSGIKICGIGDRGPATRNVLIEDCRITGRVTIKPQNAESARDEAIENITLRNCTIKPFGNTGVRIAAKNVRCENVTIDFRDVPNRDVIGFVVTDYFGRKPENVTISKDCKMLTNADQNPTLIEADIEVKRE